MDSFAVARLRSRLYFAYLVCVCVCHGAKETKEIISDTNEAVDVKYLSNTSSRVQKHDKLMKPIFNTPGKTARKRKNVVFAIRPSEDETAVTQNINGHLKFVNFENVDNSLRETKTRKSEEYDNIYSNCPAKCLCKFLECDCRSLNLSCVPTDLNENITKLDLAQNEISELPVDAFKRYKKLKHLRLKSNKLIKLNNSSFCGLTHLIRLDLSNNFLSMVNGTFPKGVFKDLTSLRVLRINSNNNTSEAGDDFGYPDEALADLTSLSTLYTDGLKNKTLGSKFFELKNLKNLQMTGFVDGYCNLHSVNNETFQHVRWLTVLNISNCHLYHIHPSTFEHLKNLTSLDIHYNENLGIDNFPQITQSLKNSRLKFLDASTIESRYSTGKSVNSSHIRNLPSTLEILKVAGNSIETVESKLFQNLPPRLKELQVGKNKLEFGNYLQNLPYLQELTTLGIRGEDFMYDIPTAFPSTAQSSDSRQSKIGKRSLRSGKSLSFPIPPNLEYLDLYNAGLNYKLTSLTLNSSNSLNFLNLDRNYLPELEGPFLGFHHLEDLSIADSFVSFINYRFFSNLTSLKMLNLSGNILGDFFGENKFKIYRSLKNLSVLNLSFNSIVTLHYNIFEGLYNLTELNLSRNKMSNFDVSVNDLTSITLLNLSNNDISRLPSHVMEHISHIRASRSILVDLSGNPIECTCENLEFLQWMISSKCFKTFENYRCRQMDGSLLILKDGYTDTIDVLTRQCASNITMFLIIVGVTVLAVSILLAMIVFRFRWKLRYLYYAAHLSYTDKGRTDFEYDVFVSYFHTDEPFVVETLCLELQKRGVKVYVHGLNFVAGNFITSNIVHAVKVCRKTLVILTKKMVKSYWCNYEVQMANMEAVSTGRSVLVFLFKETVPVHRLGELLGFINTNTYVSFPEEDKDDERKMTMFFDKLARDLK
ncbi:hypothetical protein Btru_041448 [Bulinus truncatus]|nr:hypothetical protein Btru_041448 [Bulinus truncatus]